MKSTMLLLLALFLSGVAAGQGKDDRQLLMETD